MATGKEIRTKIESIKKTQKITRAMELVAASKMRKAQDRMLTSRPYAEKVSQVIGHLANAHPEYHHPFLEDHKEKKSVGYIIVTTDRGLCGGLNNALLKKVLSTMREQQKEGLEIDLALIGNKAAHFFKRQLRHPQFLQFPE